MTQKYFVRKAGLTLKMHLRFVSCLRESMLSTKSIMRRVVHVAKLSFLMFFFILVGSAVHGAPAEVELPPIEKRIVLGTWLPPSLGGIPCTRSYETVSGKVYDVLRCADGSGGKTGQQIRQLDSRKFRSPTDSKDVFYVLLANGDLSIRDRQGEFRVLSKHTTLWPSAEVKSAPRPLTEDPKTIGLSCYDVGYRFGHTGTSSFRGKKVNPAWDFITPERCRNDPQTQQGVQAGSRAAG